MSWFHYVGLKRRRRRSNRARRTSDFHLVVFFQTPEVFMITALYALQHPSSSSLPPLPHKEEESCGIYY